MLADGQTALHVAAAEGSLAAVSVNGQPTTLLACFGKCMAAQLLNTHACQTLCYASPASRKYRAEILVCRKWCIALAYFMLFALHYRHVC